MALSKISLILGLCLFSAYATANECSLYGDTKGAIRCLNDKVKKLEAQLAKTSANIELPIGAIMTFRRHECPTNWILVSSNDQGSNKDLVVCEKIITTSIAQR